MVTSRRVIVLITSPSLNPARSAGLSALTVWIIALGGSAKAPLERMISERITKQSRKFIVTPASRMMILCQVGLSTIRLPSGTTTSGYASSPSGSPAIDTKPPIGMARMLYWVSSVFFFQITGPIPKLYS